MRRQWHISFISHFAQKLVHVCADCRISIVQSFPCIGSHTGRTGKVLHSIRKLFWLGNEAMRNLRQLLKLHISGRPNRCFPGPGLDWTRALCLCSVFHYKVLSHICIGGRRSIWTFSCDVETTTNSHIVFLSSLPNFHFAHLALWSILMEQTIEFSISLNTSRLHRAAIALPQQDYRRLKTLARWRFEFVRCLHAFMF